MTPCARGCCFTGLGVCYRQRACACHFLDAPRNEPRGSDSRRHRDPTANEAIRNITRKQGRKNK